MADQYIEVSGSSDINNYANVSLIKLEVQGQVIISESVYEEACIKDVNDGLNKTNILNDQNFRRWRRKRIRKCKIQIIKQAFAQVQDEVPDSSIFIMLLARDACNLKVQVLANRYGNAIHYLEEIVQFKDIIKRSFNRLPLRLQNKRHLNQRKELLSD
ncbi:1565_t:CDS:2 [Funneliformis geosporum]|nr:1565_t:CDS:2 [Funneliformis geosporum]